jgi:aspartyl-tRNA(Asn)/glutamyl-tRNA(Gln) amidotransferase subunit C
MTIDKATVARIATLARIHVKEEEKAPLAAELQGMLSWIEQLREVNTDEVPPLTSVVEARLPQREDVVTDGGYGDAVLANAPKAAANFFVVPKVVE